MHLEGIFSSLTKSEGRSIYSYLSDAVTRVFIAVISATTTAYARSSTSLRDLLDKYILGYVARL